MTCEEVLAKTDGFTRCTRAEQDVMIAHVMTCPACVRRIRARMAADEARHRELFGDEATERELAACEGQSVEILESIAGDPECTAVARAVNKPS